MPGTSPSLEMLLPGRRCLGPLGPLSSSDHRLTRLLSTDGGPHPLHQPPSYSEQGCRARTVFGRDGTAFQILREFIEHLS